MIFFDVLEFKNNLKQDHRLLGLDVGKVKIGYALSDLRKVIATGYGTFNLKKQKFSSETIKNIINNEQVYGIVVGYPLQMDGNEGEACAMVNKFIHKYLVSLNQPIFLQDERLSTAAVGRYFREMEIDRKKQASLKDKAAASYILQNLLDKLGYV